MIQINVNRSRIFVISNYRIFAPNFFNFKIIFALSIFENFVASKVFFFNFRYYMPRQSPVGKIQHYDDGFEYFAVAHTVILFYCGRDGYLWVHPSAVINITPGYGNISTTIRTPKRELFLINVSRSSILVGVNYGWLNSGVRLIFCVSPVWVRDIYQKFYRLYYFSQQRDLSQLFCTCNQIHSDTFPR